MKDTKQLLLTHVGSVADLLPPTLKDFALAIGLEATMVILDRFGGLDVLIPKQPSGTVYEHLVAAIGKTKAAALVAGFGGERFYINRCESLKRLIRDQLFIEQLHTLMETGMNQTQAIKELAILFDISERYGYEILRKVDADRPVVDLFNYDE